MTPTYCGNCGAPLQPGSTFCIQCGSPVPPSAPVETTVPPVVPPAVPPTPPPVSPTYAPPFGPQPQAPPTAAPGYWPGVPYAPPPKKKSPVLLIAIVAAAVAITVIAAAVLLFQAKAHFVSITKAGVSGNSMTFDVTVATEGTSIGVDKLHVDIPVDPNNLSAFTYEFVLEVNGTVMDQSTVT